jgi:hypothetical protein
MKLLGIAGLAAVLGGCSASHSRQASMGMVGQDNKVLSLAAGDTLGRAVYVNDMILAAAKIDAETAYTNVDLGTVEVADEPRY